MLIQLDMEVAKTLDYYIDYTLRTCNTAGTTITFGSLLYSARIVLQGCYPFNTKPSTEWICTPIYFQYAIDNYIPNP